MSQSTTTCVNSSQQHRDQAPEILQFAVITVSDTRTIETDRSGQLIVEQMSGKGHRMLGRDIVPDEPDRIVAAIDRLRRHRELDVILVTGGTGLSPRDRTPEAVAPLLDLEIPGFGELFRYLSYLEIGAAAMLSRAVAGRAGHQLIFCLPGSTAAVRLALEKLLLPELPHLVFHARNP